MNTLVVYGDRSGPPALANPVARLVYEPRGTVTRLIHPTHEEFTEALELAEALWFWGHGNAGGLWLAKGVFFSLEDVRAAALHRETPLQLATLRACHTLSSLEAEQAWLMLADRVEGFRGVTMEWWGRINPMIRLPR